MKKSILIIAKDYPPSSQSSGFQRLLKFSQYLPELNWNVHILTLWKYAYGKDISEEQLSDIPASVSVHRCFGLNTALHLSLKGRYFSWMAVPDKWITWLPFAVCKGLFIIKKNRPAIILSSYPCSTAHLIGLILHYLTGIKWVADFRDPMIYKEEYTKNLEYTINNWIEKKTLKYCSKAIFTTPGAINYYIKKRYPEYTDDKFVMIANGFDEQNFIESAKSTFETELADRPLVFLHAGFLYRIERDPTFFFRGLASLFNQELLRPGSIKIILRAAGYQTEYSDLIKKFGLQNVVFLESAIPYKQALSEMMSVDALLLFQGSICNHQIPAKIYEYFRAKKPIFALTDHQGDTAALLREAGINSIASIDNDQDIANKFNAFCQQLVTGEAPIAQNIFIAQQSRYARTLELNSALESVLKIS